MSSVIYPSTNPAATEQWLSQRGEGVYVFDDKGKRYLEALSGLWCNALGYGNQELIEAAREQMQTLAYSHLFGGRSHAPAMRLAEELAAVVPVRSAKSFFGTSGSDANDTHWKLLRYYFNAIGQPQRRKLIAREGAYHGVTVAAAAMTGLPINHQHFDLPMEALGIVRAPGMHYYREAMPGESELDFSSRRASELETLIDREGAETIAAFIAEPVNGAGGVIVPPRGYWEKIQAVLRRHGILFIADEVITGFGRTGTAFGCATYDIEPDMMTAAKALTSGYLPLSASIVRGDLYEAMVEPAANVGAFGHGYTYSGHPVSCAVALATLRIYRRDRVFEHAAKVGRYFQRRLGRLSDHPLVGDVRGVGLLGALELMEDPARKKPFADNTVSQFMQQSAMRHGVIVRSLGPTIALCPPLIITEAQVDELVVALEAALDDSLEFARRGAR
ncbi:aminotransferase [Pseudohaliea sp.]|uniref:aminotransferase n=1 Tax=Pseudohaliea sp. TaxID=2740289 RepID=UPI0032EF9474